MMMNRAAQVLADLVALRNAKKSLKEKDYKRQKADLWDQAEKVLRETQSEATPGDTEQHQGATITHRPDVAYEAARDARSGDYTLTVSADDRDYLGRKLSDDRKEGVPSADRVLASLGFIDN